MVSLLPHLPQPLSAYSLIHSSRRFLIPLQLKTPSLQLQTPSPKPQTPGTLGYLRPTHLLFDLLLASMMDIPLLLIRLCPYQSKQKLAHVFSLSITYFVFHTAAWPWSQVRSTHQGLSGAHTSSLLLSYSCPSTLHPK